MLLAVSACSIPSGEPPDVLGWTRASGEAALFDADCATCKVEALARAGPEPARPEEVAGPSDEETLAWHIVDTWERAYDELYDECMRDRGWRPLRAPAAAQRGCARVPELFCLPGPRSEHTAHHARD